MITDWSQLPLVLHTEDLAALYRVKVSTVWKWCQRRTLPVPIHGWDGPVAYTWYRDAVKLSIESPRRPAARGNAFARVVRAKAALAENEKGRALVKTASRPPKGTESVCQP